MLKLQSYLIAIRASSFLLFQEVCAGTWDVGMASFGNKLLAIGGATMKVLESWEGL